jgi:hypothetical protein
MLWQAGWAIEEFTRGMAMFSSLFCVLVASNGHIMASLGMRV